MSYVWQQVSNDALAGKCFLIGAASRGGATEPPRPALPPPPAPPLPPLVGCSELPATSATTAMPMPAPVRRFVLVTSAARVGSNWLRSLLNQHPWLHMESELLSMTSYSYRKRRHNFTYGLRSALDAAWATAEAAAAAAAAATAAATAATAATASATGGAGGGAGLPTVGWKAGGPQMTTVCNCTPKQLLLETTRRDGAALVYLHREDAASIALSLEIARRSQVFVQRGGKRGGGGAAAAATAAAAANDSAVAAAFNSSAPIVLANVSDFVRRVRNFAKHATTFRALLDARLTPYVAVSYEALYRDPTREAARVFEHLGLPRCAVNATAMGTTRKLGASSFRQSVANWAELCAALDAAELRTPLWRRSCAL